MTKYLRPVFINDLAIEIAKAQGYEFSDEAMADKRNPRAEMFTCAATLAFEKMAELFGGVENLEKLIEQHENLSQENTKDIRQQFYDEYLERKRRPS